MGAGCSLKRQYSIKYNRLQWMLVQLYRAGGLGTYKAMEINGTLNGHTLRAYWGRTSYASNGECFAALYTGIDGGEMEAVNWLDRLEQAKEVKNA